MYLKREMFALTLKIKTFYSRTIAYKFKIYKKVYFDTRFVTQPNQKVNQQCHNKDTKEEGLFL